GGRASFIGIAGTSPAMTRRRHLAQVSALSEPDRGAVQVVVVGALDLDGGDLAYAQRPVALHIDRAVDLRRVALAAALGDRRPDRVDDDLLAGAELALEPPRRDRLLMRHQAMPALLFHRC